MPDLDGYKVLELLKDDPATRDIPVIIHTSAVLSPEQTAQLNQLTTHVLCKGIPKDQPLATLNQVLAAPLAKGAP